MENVAPFGRQDEERLFVVKGIFYLMSACSIHVLEDSFENNRWKEIHSFSLPDTTDFHVGPVDGELLTVFNFPNEEGINELSLLRSKGFGSSSKELLWKKATCSLIFPDTPCMYPIQL